ncbi:MAG TPA: leucyl/phenylalanyl-tRNA--protein transferase [Methylibium sp.]|nr:leucyl/phenylalanyl-tRNA--protein transferase [Methylibium sp.]
MLTWLHTPATPLPDTAFALPSESEAPGLLAAGEDLSPARLAEAYARGIFPWYGAGQPVLWWSPDPRMVLPVAEFRLSHSLRKAIRRFIDAPGCALRIDSAFERVITTCAAKPRAGQDGTWIQPELRAAYTAWHRLGAVHSFETWIDGELVGGLYGVSLGRMFYGESMFAHRTDASKIAIAALVAYCRAEGIALIDCQQRTAHLASLGAREIARPAFEGHLARVVREPAPRDWTYHRSHWAQLGFDGAVRAGPALATSPSETAPRAP